MDRHLYYTTTIKALYEDVVDLLTRDAAGVLGELSRGDAEDNGPVATLHARVLGSTIDREITIHPAPIEPLGRHARRVPVEWHAEQSAGLYPVMQGTLEVSALSVRPPRTQIAFIGRYTPPFGPVGALGDRLAGHEVAEESVERFVDEVVARIVASLETSTPHVPAG